VRLPALVAACWALALTARAAEAPPKGGEDPLDALAAQMAELVNRDRAEHKLPPLGYHKGLAAVARAHCADMRANRFFAHDSPRTGSAKDRIAAARIPNRGSGENLAFALTIEVAEKNLMNSPKHKENILSPQFTHVGIGLLRADDGHLMVTQVFIKAVPIHDVAAVRDQIAEGVNKERLAKGLRRLLPDDALSELALEHSLRSAKLGKHDPLWLEDQISRRDKRWRLTIGGYYLTDKPDEVIRSDIAFSPSPDHFGVGVVQAPAESKQAGSLWVTILCAQKK